MLVPKLDKRLPQVALCFGVFVVSLAWFWFWRPCGFYGGDWELVERAILQGEWFMNRELLSTAAMQLSRRLVCPLFGWPVSWAISLVSCLAGAVTAAVLWKIVQTWEHPVSAFFLALCSGYALLFHGAIESYALPTCFLALWIWVVQGVEERGWPSWLLPICFAGMICFHLVASFFLPALCLSFWIYRRRILKQEWRYWAGAMAVAAGVYLFTDVLKIGRGYGFEGAWEDYMAPGKENFGPLLSCSRLGIIFYFLWMGTLITLPLALAEVLKRRSDTFTLQVGTLALCGLGFVFTFHPDLGYEDWDLFLLPSLPLAVLGARFAAASPRRAAFATVWVAAFLCVWFPRIPVWADLPHRGLARVAIRNLPADSEVKIDDRYPVEENQLLVQGGMHTLSVRKPGYRVRWRSFLVSPGDSILISLPQADLPGPYAEKIRALLEEDDRQ